MQTEANLKRIEHSTNKKLRKIGINGKTLLLVPALLFLLVFLIIPLIKVLLNSVFDTGFTTQYYSRFFKESAYFLVLWNTIKVSFLITGITLILGYPVSYMLSSVSEQWRNILLIFVLLPFWTSFLVRTYAWMVILQKEGIVNKILLALGIISEPLTLVHNSVGVIIGLTHVLLPFMILPLYSVMRGIDMDLVKAAQSLGASPFKTFLKVFLPLSIPGIAAGSILVFIISIGYYVTPALLGGSKDTMISQLIAQQIGEQLNWGFGSAIAVILLAVVFLLLYLFNKFVGMDKISFGP
ncbi:ABC transporter permease [Neobacillus niacini]|uniref:ABC transporter permease n=1 Tax=Neobacillus niacini TaxID=86668 RepID=UPI00285B08CA|nr:ABC transporter permease [Neobacillus niacini]MDR6997826.1 ABC-type spermidine/putrescine transport system permease subunit I [Neobacillus niacini]